MRTVLAAVAAVLGYCSVTFSLAHVVVKSDPALAYRLAPYDGRIIEAYATTLADRVRADNLAKLALRRNPTAVAAVATLGMNADLRGDKAAARRYFTYAQKLSRRNLRTQLWMIEDAVQREDIPAALHQYDITLRVLPNLGKMLYPVLASATGDPVIRADLVKMLRRKPSWGRDFIAFIAESGPDPRSTAALLVGLRRAGVPIPEAADADVVNALLAAGQSDVAWSYYTAIRPGADRRHSRDPRFAGKLERPSHLDWVPLNDGGLVSSIHGGIFDFSGPASVGGAMLQQLQLLPPGSYRLIGHSMGIDQVQDARPYWVLSCRGGRELGRIEVPNSNVTNGAFTGIFSVPVNCPIQILILIARPSNAVSGLSGQFDHVELAPAR
jgi:hypothetical protein